jgi:hypothetical protein
LGIKYGNQFRIDNHDPSSVGVLRMYCVGIPFRLSGDHEDHPRGEEELLQLDGQHTGDE